MFATKLPEINDLPTTFRLSLQGVGCLVGEEDAILRSS